MKDEKLLHQITLSPSCPFLSDCLKDCGSEKGLIHPSSFIRHPMLVSVRAEIYECTDRQLCAELRPCR